MIKDENITTEILEDIVANMTQKSIRSFISDIDKLNKLSEKSLNKLNEICEDNYIVED